MTRRRELHVFAVQPDVRVEDLGTPGRFAARLRRLLAPVARRPAGADALVVFPAHVGTLLVFELLEADGPRARRLAWALACVARRRLGGCLRAAARHRLRRPRAALWLGVAPELHGRYIDIFGGLAREHGAWIVAGSVALPRNGFGPDALHFWPAVAAVHEISYTFDPAGRVRLEAARSRPDPDDPLGVGPAGPIGGRIVVDAPFGGLATVWSQEGLLTASCAATAGARVLCQPEARWRPRWAEPASLLPERLAALPTVAAAVGCSLRGRLFEYALDGPASVAVRGPAGRIEVAPAEPAGEGSRRDAVAHAVIAG